MIETLGTDIKLAVDIEQEVAAGGGALHADCEAVLLEAGCRQLDIWGADWVPSSQEVLYEALINIRPSQSNPSMTILDSEIRARVRKALNHCWGAYDRSFPSARKVPA